MHACARICVEVDLGKGLLESIKIKVHQWTHIQQLDYKKIPFKCKVCHEYSHFANRCNKLKETEIVENVEVNESTWEQVKRKKTTNKQSGPNPKQRLENVTAIPTLPLNMVQPIPSTSNPFETLEEEEPLHSPSHDKTLVVIHSPIQNFPSPPPTIERILTRNEVKESNNTSQQPKKASRKSNKEIRDDATAKEMATGTQQPMDSFLAKQKESGESKRRRSGLIKNQVNNDFGLLEQQGFRLLSKNQCSLRFIKARIARYFHDPRDQSDQSRIPKNNEETKKF